MLTSLKVLDHIHTDTKIIDEISLSYEDRFIRRKKLIANNGTEFLVNLEETKSVDENYYFKLDSGEAVSYTHLTLPTILLV